MGLITGYTDTTAVTSDDRMLGLDGGATKLIRPDDIGEYVVGRLGAVTVGDATGVSATDTTNIDAAWSRAQSEGKKLRLGKGSYSYDGSGLSGSQVFIEGPGPDLCTVTPTAGKWFVNTSALADNIDIRGFRLGGGAGLYKSTYASAQTGTGIRRFVDLILDNYTSACISTESVDNPRYMFERCVFTAANDSTAIGVAHSGLANTSSFRDCSFRHNRVHIKMQNPQDAQIINCEFFYASNTPSNERVSVWIVPNSTGTNAGEGLVIRDTKFGNENESASDYRVLYADQKTGTFNGDKWPELAADSTGFIQGHVISDCHVAAGTNTRALIYSTTPKLRGCVYGPNILDGTIITQVLEYRTVPAPLVDNLVVIYPHYTVKGYAQSAVGITSSNDPAAHLVPDPAGVAWNWNVTSAPQDWVGGADMTNHVDLGPGALSGGWTSGGAITDALGGTDALTFTSAGGTSVAANLGTTPTVGRPIWVEFDARGSGTPMTEVIVRLRYTSGGAIQWNRAVKLSTTWRRWRFLAFVRGVSSAVVLQFADVSGGSGGGGIDIGRVRAYHAREPIPSHLVAGKAATTTTAPSAGGAAALPATPAGYMTVFINGTARQVAYY